MTVETFEMSPEMERLAAEAQAFNDAHPDFWCRCGNPSEDVAFYADGQHPEVHKHHWRCNDCGSVLQIG